MATTLFIPGPTVVSIGADILGYSDNDTLPAISFTDYHHEVKTVLSGNAPEEVVMQGTVAKIAVALVKWDQAVLTSLLTTARGGSGTTPVVGRRVIADTGYFLLTIESVAGNGSYEFSHAYLQPESVGDSQWGNRERVLTLNFSAIAADGDPLYAIA